MINIVRLLRLTLSLLVLELRLAMLDLYISILDMKYSNSWSFLKIFVDVFSN